MLLCSPPLCPAVETPSSPSTERVQTLGWAMQLRAAHPNLEYLAQIGPCTQMPWADAVSNFGQKRRKWWLGVVACEILTTWMDQMKTCISKNQLQNFLKWVMANVKSGKSPCEFKSSGPEPADQTLRTMKQAHPFAFSSFSVLSQAPLPGLQLVTASDGFQQMVSSQTFPCSI